MEDEVNLREYLEVIVKRWKIIISLTIGLGLAALIFSFLQGPVYEAKTTVMVRGGGGGGSLSKLANFAGLAGISLPSKGGSLNDLTGVLQSQAVAAKVLKDLNLRERIDGWDNPNKTDQKLTVWVRRMLEKPKINGNLLELKVQWNDPELAAEIANGYVNALSYYWNRLNYTEARKKKEYIEGQLPRVEKELKLAERNLKKYTLLAPKGGTSNSALLGMVSGSQSQGIEVSRLSRERDIQDSVYTMLRKEYETVKLEESREIPPFSVVDEAVVPDSRIKPKKKLNTLVGLVLGMFLGISVAFFQEYLVKKEIKL
jgi:uncharacterized protein involved in exopolysaccharide biosynthesis